MNNQYCDDNVANENLDATNTENIIIPSPQIENKGEEIEPR